MHSYKDIFGLNVKYIEFLLSRSLFSHQYIKNISQSGDDVEGEVREMFRSIIPERFKITHGYIVSAPDQRQEPYISPQVDMMIVDTLVPHSIFVVDKKNGLEIVPREAVVGIFEIKRTLTYKILKDAVHHIKDIRNSTRIQKNSLERYGPGGLVFKDGLIGGAYWNPLLGIIGLDIDNQLIKEGHAHYAANTFDEFREAELDIIASFKGILCAVMDEKNKANFRIANPRTANETVNYLLLKTDIKLTQANIIAKMFGYILAYLYQTTGKVANINNYFFNDSL